jgi:hypothetical protein
MAFRAQPGLAHEQSSLPPFQSGQAATGVGVGVQPNNLVTACDGLGPGRNQSHRRRRH